MVTAVSKCNEHVTNTLIDALGITEAELDPGIIALLNDKGKIKFNELLCLIYSPPRGLYPLGIACAYYPDELAALHRLARILAFETIKKRS